VLISRTKACTSLFTFVTFFGGTSLAADDATLLKDLTAVIALLGLPCGQVVSATRQADNDHIATCNNGNRYRVFVNPQGRVVAEKR
jgi:hypothetical protein